jgi:hypothetical protein
VDTDNEGESPGPEQDAEDQCVLEETWGTLSSPPSAGTVLSLNV